MRHMTTASLIAPVMQAQGISQRQLARASGLSLPAINAIVARGQWPKRRAAAAQARVLDALRKLGATAADLIPVAAAIRPAKKLAPDAATPEADPPTQDPSQEQEDEPMLLKNETLTPLARERFALRRNPFVDDIQGRADVYTSEHARYARAALMETAIGHGFLALIGESGSGKSTLREELEERIREEGKPVVVIKPYVIGSEPTDTRGKAMKAGQIAESIVTTLAPGVSLKSSPQARYKQVHDLLKASRSAGYSHLLVIEEAHRLSVPTLKHLKNFMELKDGLRRLLGVCLIGQPELHDLLSERNPEIREIVQRCEQIVMRPLDSDLQGYLEHKFARVGLELKNVFGPDALDAIRQRLVSVPRGGRAQDAVSVCYPLIVNNLVCRALNTAAAAGWNVVDAQVIAEC